MYQFFFCYTTVNIAAKKTAKQSSTVGSAEAGLATDSNYEATTAADLCAVTHSEVSPWWRVDLARTYDVARVDVTGCSDCDSKFIGACLANRIELKPKGRRRVHIKGWDVTTHLHG